MTFTQDELGKIKTKKDKSIHVEHFAKMAEIDTILFDKNYYLVPENGAEKAYEPLRRIKPSKPSIRCLRRNTELKNTVNHKALLL